MPNTVDTQPDCKDPRAQRNNECQSWRQAEAAEEQTCIARRQFWTGTLISIIGLLVLLFSINYAARSVGIFASWYANPGFNKNTWIPLFKHPLLYVWVFVFGAFAASWLIDKGPAEQQLERAAESKQAPETKKTERAPSTVAKGVQAKKDKDATKRGNAERDKEQKSWADFTLTDALVALFTGVLTIVAGLQAYYTWSTMVATKLAARGALRSAITAKRTVDQMSDTAERQLRAYVSIEESTLTRLDGAAKAQAVLIIRNTGQTPAYGFQMRAQTNLAAYPLAVELVPLAVDLPLQCLVQAALERSRPKQAAHSMMQKESDWSEGKLPSISTA
jgi:ABC-type multidrug transport system fused ATPase/permease subunit